MFAPANIRPLDQDAIVFKRRALKDTIICMGWLKMTSITCFMVLYFLVHTNSKGETSFVIQLMILLAIPAQILHGILLIFGALEERPMVLEMAIWLCLLLASYNTVLGVIGAVYFIRTGNFTMHFILAIIFALLGLSLFTVLCHDVLIVYSYKQLLLRRPPEDPET